MLGVFVSLAMRIADRFDSDRVHQIQHNERLMDICVRFVNSPDVVTDLIKLETWSPVSHVELITQDGKNSIGARSEGGVQFREVYYEKLDLEERYWITVDDELGENAWT